MKTTLLVLISLILYFNITGKKLLKKVTIGKFSYSIYKETQYSHDDDLSIDYFVLYTTGQNKQLCSAYLGAKRNDTTFIKGHYLLYPNRIEFTTIYFYTWSNSTDSSKTVFYPNKRGSLILKEVIDFKNGNPKAINY